MKNIQNILINNEKISKIFHSGDVIWSKRPLNLLINGDFKNGLDGWFFHNSVYHDGENVIFPGVGYIYQPINLEEKSHYKVIITAKVLIDNQTYISLDSLDSNLKRFLKNTGGELKTQTLEFFVRKKLSSIINVFNYNINLKIKEIILLKG